MVNEKLIAFILRARQNKRNDEQILQQLLSVGWKQDAIDEAFSEIKSKKITAQAPAPAPKQAAAAAPPWVKPAQQPAPSQPIAAPASAPAQPASQPAPAQQNSQSIQPPSMPAQPTTAPPWAAQTAQPQSAPAPPQIQPPLQQPTLPVMPQPQPNAQPSAIPPVQPIQLPPQKKSLFSSLFAKKPAAVQAPQQQPTAPPQQPARQPVFPPQAPSQATLPIQPPVQPPSAPKGQATLSSFSEGTAPAPIAPPPIQSAAPPTAAAPAKPSGGLMKFLPIIAFVLILAAAGAYYFLVVVPSASAPSIPTQPIAPSVQNITPSVPVQKAAGPTDCGTDMDCFIRASSTCQPAKMTRSSTVDFFGMLLSGTTYMEIQNASEPGKCSLYSLTANSSVKLSDTMVAAALAKGLSMDDIRKQEAESTRQAQATVGLDGTCKFDAAYLPALLSNWKSGSYSSSDLSGADCRGKLYESSSSGSGNYSSSGTVKGKNGSNYTMNFSYNYSFNYSSNTSKGKTSASNKTNSTSSGTPKTNASTSAPKANATQPAANASTNLVDAYTYSRKYFTYYPEHLVWFCTDRSMEFYRMHWQEYFGSGCNSEKPKQGYVNYTDYVATGCTVLPCCINGPYNEYSRSYDYFECGYNVSKG